MIPTDAECTHVDRIVGGDEVMRDHNATGWRMRDSHEI